MKGALLWSCLLLAGPLQALEEFSYRVVGKLPHSRGDFVQGLEIRDGRLYQGTGGYGRSRLQVFELASGRLLRSRELSPAVFGEGITVFGDEIVQLSWRSGRALVYRREDLEPLSEFALPGQGWGLTNDGQRLIYSDGSDRLYSICPAGWHIEPLASVTLNGQPLPRINELEWTPDYLLANIWGQDWIAMIDLQTGAVTGRVDLSGLLPPAERQPGTDVLNGIARDPDTGALWVTGKNWPWLYQIELRRKNAVE